MRRALSTTVARVPADLNYMRRALSTTAARVPANLTYMCRPPPGLHNGRQTTAQHWAKIGSAYAQEAWMEGDVSSLRHIESHHTMDVTDARHLPTPLTLAENGFELRTSPSRVRDFYDDDEVRRVYYDEAAELVRTASGARECYTFMHMRRDSSLANKEVAQAAGGGGDATAGATANAAASPAHGAIQIVHSDYTETNAASKLAELEELQVVPAGRAAGRRFAIVNVWRSIDAVQPITSLPLAMLDAATVQPEECFRYALVNAEAEPPLAGYANSVGHSDAHRWYYYDKMVADEALLLYTYDGNTSPPRFVFHTAVDTGGGEDRPPRRSIEVRCLAIF